MIRAHLATFPPRRRLLRQVAAAILPQVDRLFVVLNGYDAVPGFLRREARVTAVIPDRDVKDAGKFWFAPAPEDIVFTIDDDIGYPPDYVARSLALIGPMGFDGHVYGYQGNAYAAETGDGAGDDGSGGDSGGRRVWHNFLFHQPLADVRGVSLIGTGTLIARGDAIPPLPEVEPLAGTVDFAYGRWLHRHAILPWALPRAEAWLSNILPHRLRASSLFVTVHRARRPEHLAVLRSFASHRPHANIPYADFHAQAF